MHRIESLMKMYKEMINNYSAKRYCVIINLAYHLLILNNFSSFVNFVVTDILASSSLNLNTIHSAVFIPSVSGTFYIRNIIDFCSICKYRIIFMITKRIGSNNRQKRRFEIYSILVGLMPR